MVSYAGGFTYIGFKKRDKGASMKTFKEDRKRTKNKTFKYISENMLLQFLTRHSSIYKKGKLFSTITFMINN
jgi:hypothetical protein